MTDDKPITREVDGLVELLEKPSDPRLHNPDLDPTALDQRTWTTFNMATLWIGMAVCIPTYTLAADLVKSGMNWWQAMLAILLGNLIVLAPLMLNGHPGTRYGIPFPVYARAAFGIHGSHVPSLARALVACGWFGIQTYFGGEAINLTLGAMWPAWLQVGGGAELLGMTLPSWICFGLFWAVNVFFVWKGHESIKWLENLAAPFLILIGVVLLGWAVNRGGGLGHVLAESTKLMKTSEHAGTSWLLHVFLPGVTGMVGFWATLSLNIPDFTRYCRSQKDQLTGQAIGLPGTMVLFSFIGVAVTSATIVMYREPVWDPVVLVTKLAQETGSTTLAALSTFTLAVATLSTNIAANVVSPANAITNAFPRHVSFRVGGLIAAIIGVLMCPWKLLGVYIPFLLSYSGLLGAVGGVLIADYYIVRRRQLDLAALYRSDGPYAYGGRGFNPAALIATGAGVGVCLIGKLVPGLEFLFNGAWFAGTFVSMLVYVILMRGKGVARPAV
jgi:nucleobase:cation symporter-1, NCS1 family